MKLENVVGHRDLKRDLVTGKIYVRLSRQSKGSLFKSTRTDNIREARRVADKLIQEFLGLKPKGISLRLIEELWPEWLATKDGKAKATLDSINYSGKRILPFFGPLLPNDITPAKWEEYVSLGKQDEPAHKFFNERKWLRMFILWAHENGHIDKAPRLRNPDPSKSDVGRYLSREEFEKIMSESSDSLKLQILMAYTMGMRISEIMCLTWGSDRQNTSYVDLQNKCIRLHKNDTKIRKSRTFGISAPVYAGLFERHKDRVSEFVWPSQGDPSRPMNRQGNKTAWLTARKKSGVSCRFHDLRHTFLTNAFKAASGKIDSMLICEYAGLDITQAQETYLHFSVEDTRPVSDLVTL